ncbi:RidA family protein [Clostridium omnivorum]|uniref:Enamine deaminase RidA n=1 Tax=Clostridium omnivorum TaxID=1604902 RepID=A0ABQ5N5Y6_9CLOT|nr:RidA family protein [Clostridium sp. E14]GLC30560.1 enamine deaminase RidA [Clostridium sp. E14]
MKEFRNPKNIHEPVAAYAHQVEVSGQNRWLVMSGQIGKDENGFLPNDAVEQLENALDNIVRNLHAATMEVTDLVKLVFYMVGTIDAPKRGEALSKAFKGHNPCMTLMYVAGLADPSIKVEIDAWACADN